LYTLGVMLHKEVANKLEKIDRIVAEEWVVACPEDKRILFRI
jgi:hypothetical protein